MENLRNDQSREYFANSGLTYNDLTEDNLRFLCEILAIELRKSGCLCGTYRMDQKVNFKKTKRRGFEFAGLTCSAHYFSGREAVSFSPDGFIGFCGWADSINNQPILRGFNKWVDEMAAAKSRGN